MLKTWLEALRAWPLIFDLLEGLDSDTGSTAGVCESLGPCNPMPVQGLFFLWVRSLYCPLPTPSCLRMELRTFSVPSQSKQALLPRPWSDSRHHSFCILVGAKFT